MDNTPPPVETLAAAYNIGTWESVERLPGGKNQHFIVRADKGAFVLRKSHRSKTVEQIAFEHELFAYLERHLYPAPNVVNTRSGDSYVEVDGRLFRLTRFVEGEPYDGSRGQLRQVAKALAIYHGIVSLPAAPSAPVGVSLLDSVKERVALVRGYVSRNGTSSYGEDSIHNVLPFMIERAEEAIATMDGKDLPQLVIHGGCRRGSVLFKRGHLSTVLDFDSARQEIRVLDLAVALHDFGKVYTQLGADDHKVQIDHATTSAFLAAYCAEQPLTYDEVVALPALLMAKRLKRALGRITDVIDRGEQTPADARKIRLELERIHWLQEHARVLERSIVGSARVLSKSY